MVLSQSLGYLWWGLKWGTWKVLPMNLCGSWRTPPERFVWKNAVLVSLWEHKYGRRKATETFVFEFSYKCLNLSLEELIKRKVKFILRQGMFRWQNLKKSATFFNPHNNFPGAKCRVIQKPEIRHWSVLIAKRTTLSNRAYVSIKVFSCCNTLWK